jgi:hypothetical protein
MNERKIAIFGPNIYSFNSLEEFLIAYKIRVLPNPIGRPLSPMSATGVRRRERRRM